MSRRFDTQDATGRIQYIPGRGTLQAWSGNVSNVSGPPTNGVTGFAPSCLWHDVENGNVYINTGTFASATWSEMIGLTTLSSLTITTLTTSTIISATAATWTIPANTQHAAALYDGTTRIIDVDTRNTVTAVTAVKVSASPPTITAASGTTFSQFGTGAVTITLTGTTTVTALDGVGAYLGVPTITDASAGTVTTVSNLYVAAPAAAGGSLTITNSYAIHSGGGVLVDAGGVTVTAGGITLSAAAQNIVIKANTAAALGIYNGTVNVINVDTRNTITGISAVTVNAPAATIASSATDLTNIALNVGARTTTFTGTYTMTSCYGLGLTIGAQTITDASTATLTSASAVHINALAAAGGSLTITNAYMISTSVSDCYLTNAGVWTSHSSSAAIKDDIEDVATEEVFSVLDSIRPRKWRYKPEMGDQGRRRMGIVMQELPEEFRVPGNYPVGGMPDGVVASFSLAALKALRDENEQLKRRLEALERRLLAA